MKVLAIVGSLRRDSYDRTVLRAAQDLAPEGMTITGHPLGDIPLYNHDVEQQGDPEPVAAFKQAMAVTYSLT